MICNGFQLFFYNYSCNVFPFRLVFMRIFARKFVVVSVLSSRHTIIKITEKVKFRGNKVEEQKNCETEMANLGEKSLELIRESVRARDMLGPFNEEKVRLVLEEIKVLMEDVSSFPRTRSSIKK